ncbi:uncharacterized protein LOC123523395 isoform X1 [Mercenaria mercenaria]|uniref:uncharacterized protein LOC123523395 isoform X1 n=1 Tax=Mercenaria mercenaria TaxID=6596 RepID=UPI00234E74C2|nr:uncharacterized protein LOC123523395 isoform X1 [Mercenaria mercenaria]
MGCCLGKIKAKRNSVSPSYIEDEIRKRISGKSVKRDAPGASLLKEMAKQLEDAEIEESKMTKGGVSFTLDFKTGDPTRMPSRLADQLDGALTPTEDEKEVHYTASEKELLAELLREDILREKSVKARRDVQLYDAARRRAAYNT